MVVRIMNIADDISLRIYILLQADPIRYIPKFDRQIAIFIFYGVLQQGSRGIKFIGIIAHFEISVEPIRMLLIFHVIAKYPSSVH